MGHILKLSLTRDRTSGLIDAHVSYGVFLLDASRGWSNSKECLIVSEDRRINPNPPAAGEKQLLIAKIEKVYSMAVEQNNPDSALRAVELLARINGYA